MAWHLFIDDERFPYNVFWSDTATLAKYHEEDWKIARNWSEVAELIGNYGFPNFISFDHDLGENEKTGYDIVKLLIEDIMNGYYEMPADFDFYVHSQNPIGKQNIEGYLNGYIKAKNRAAEVPMNTARFNELCAIAENDEEGDITVGKRNLY